MAYSYRLCEISPKYNKRVVSGHIQAEAFPSSQYDGYYDLTLKIYGVALDYDGSRQGAITISTTGTTGDGVYWQSNSSVTRQPITFPGRGNESILIESRCLATVNPNGISNAGISVEIEVFTGSGSRYGSGSANNIKCAQMCTVTFNGSPRSVAKGTTITTPSLSIPADEEIGSWMPFTVTGKANGGSPDIILNAQRHQVKHYTSAYWYNDNIQVFPNRSLTVNGDMALSSGYDYNTIYKYKNNTMADFKRQGTPTRASSPSGSSYTVSFNTNNGTSIPSKTSRIMNKYDFNGWWNSANGGSQYQDSTEFNNTTTIYAHWNQSTYIEPITIPNLSKSNKEDKYYVKLDANGGHIDNIWPVSTITTSYAFDYWHSSDGQYIYNNGGSFTPSGNSMTISLTAYWTESQSGSNDIYLPTLNPKNPLIEDYSINLNITRSGVLDEGGTKIPCNKTTAYTFEGWTRTRNGSQIVSDPYPGKISEYETLYAKWSIDEYNSNIEEIYFPLASKDDDITIYNVELRARNSTVDRTRLQSTKTTSYTNTGWSRGESIMSPHTYYTPSRAGETWTSEWEVIGPNQPGIEVPDAHDHTITTKENSIVLNLNGGHTSLSIPENTLKSSQTTSYIFLGWSTDPNAEGPNVDKYNYIPDRNGIILYDVWSPEISRDPVIFPNITKDEIREVINIDLVVQDGTVASRTAHSDIVTTFDFKEWNIPGIGSFGQGESYTPETNLSANAVWTKHGPTQQPAILPEASGKPNFEETYNLYLDLDGGNPLSYSYISTTHRIVYRFSGWSTSPSRDSIIDSGNYMPKESGTKLYDVWEESSNKVDPIELPTTTKNSKIKNMIVTLKARHSHVASEQLRSIIETKYTFNGWRTPEGIRYEGNTYTPNRNGIHITALWYENNPIQNSVMLPTPSNRSDDKMVYTVTLDVNGGNPLKNNKLEATRTITYSFKGWTETSEESTEVIPDTVPTEYTPLTNITLYDVWDIATDETTPIMLPRTNKNDVVDFSHKVTIKYASKPTEVNNVNTVSRYDFIGWWKNRTAGQYDQPSIGSYTPRDNEILYAIFDKNTIVGSIELERDTKEPLLAVYEVTLNANPATVSPDHYTRTNKEIYTFLGWDDGLSEERLSGKYTPTQDVTLNPIWDVKGTPPEPINLPTPVSPGREFLGWRESDGGDVENANAYVPDRTVTLIAIWKINGAVRINGKQYAVWIYTSIPDGNLQWKQYVPYVFHHTSDQTTDWKAGQ